MNSQYEALYKLMLQDIGKSWQLPLSEREKSESCFWIAHDYWGKLKKLVRLDCFKSEEEEIDFLADDKIADQAKRILTQFSQIIQNAKQN